MAKSAYELALEYGFVGTEAEYLEACISGEIYNYLMEPPASKPGASPDFDLPPPRGMDGAMILAFIMGALFTGIILFLIN